jgi:hypothetical protein
MDNLSIALTILLPVILYIAGSKVEPDWSNELRWSWRKTLIVSSVAALLGGALATFAGVGSYIVSAMILLFWIAPIVVLSDYVTYKIPRGPSKIVYTAALVPLIAYSISLGSFVPSFVALGCLLVPFLLMFSSGIGFGDIRLLFFFSLGLSWWVGVQAMITGLFISCALGLIQVVVANFTKSGKPLERKSGYIKRYLGKLKGKDVPLQDVTRRALPFGPPLIAAYMTVAVWSLFNPTYCDTLFNCMV